MVVFSRTVSTSLFSESNDPPFYRKQSMNTAKRRINAAPAYRRMSTKWYHRLGQPLQLDTGSNQMFILLHKESQPTLLRRAGPRKNTGWISCCSNSESDQTIEQIKTKDGPSVQGPTPSRRWVPRIGDEEVQALT